MSLSDRIQERRGEELNKTIYLEFLYTKHVKEFIQELKEDYKRWCYDHKDERDFDECIDELAGKELSQ